MNQDKTAAFDAEWNAHGRAVVTPARGGNADKFKPELNTVYDRLAILREPSWEIPSKNPTWAPSVAVNLVNLENGHRMDWWFASTSSNGRNSIFRDRLTAMLEAAKEEGHNYPIEFKFRIQERTSEHTCNTYKLLQPMFVASGNNIKGDLGLNPRDDPNNDASIPSQGAKVVSHADNRATDEQWSSIKNLLLKVLGTGYSAEDAVAWFAENDISIEKDNISGSPDGTGLPRIGYGNLNTSLATEMVNTLTLAVTE